ncbi:hypothetical protein [Nocardioides terrisoli]|uniref:hypothetical protein n=1 Tax=Nocardioides terrisoli TaxID=3388267 RepID=UPI00287B6683|nr:hypothetical protein [Nocardioides marmorisolisilvae]
MTVAQTSEYNGTARRSDAVVLDAVVDARRRSMRAAIDELSAGMAWAHAHPGSRGECAAWEPGLMPADEDGLDHLGGEGTPAVTEFAVEQLAVRLGVSTGSAMQLVADVLDLAHRHPRLWSRVLSGR